MTGGGQGPVRSDVQVKSRPGVLSSLNIALGLAIGVVLVGAMVAALVYGGFAPAVLLGFVAGPAIALIAVTGMTLKLRVDLDGIDKRDLWGRRRVRWDRVREIQIVPTFFSTYGINVYLTTNERRLSLMLPFVGNRMEVARAILEAATIANPDVVVRGLVGSPYGEPPYGVFERGGTQS